MILAQRGELRQMGRPIALSDAEQLVSGLARTCFAPAEYSLANLWLFRAVHGYRWLDEPVPHLRGVTYDGRVHALPLGELGREAALALFATGIQCLYPFGQNGPELAARLGLECAYEEADSDYWFRGADMSVLAGAKKRRAQARQFAAEAEPTFESWSPELAQDARAVLQGWVDDITRPAEETDIGPCEEAIERATELGLEGCLVRSKGEAVAFLLASVRGDTRIVHFAKGRRAHSNAYPWMFATYAAHSRATWLNFEQDLGIAGLAQSKRAYAPARTEPKFRLRKSLLV